MTLVEEQQILTLYLELAEDEDKYDYELEHFGAGGDKYLGGENIIKELAVQSVYRKNSNNLLNRRIQYKTRGLWWTSWRRNIG